MCVPRYTQEETPWTELWCIVSQVGVAGEGQDGFSPLTLKRRGALWQEIAIDVHHCTCVIPNSPESDLHANKTPIVFVFASSHAHCMLIISHYKWFILTGGEALTIATFANCMLPVACMLSSDWHTFSTLPHTSRPTIDCYMKCTDFSATATFYKYTIEKRTNLAIWTITIQ